MMKYKIYIQKNLKFGKWKMQKPKKENFWKLQFSIIYKKISIKILRKENRKIDIVKWKKKRINFR